MKLTHTLRTIAFSGLGLLAGASTLTIPAQDAHAMSGTPVMAESRATWINLELTESIQVGGELSVRGKLGCTSLYLCSMNNSDDVVDVVVRDASGAPIWSDTLAVDNAASVLDENGEWTTNPDHRTFSAKTGITAPGLYSVEASYAARSVYVEGGANPGNMIYYYSASTSATAVSFGCDESYPDENIDGIDQNCDLVDGLNEDGDGFASVEVGGTDCDDNDASTYPGAEDLYGDGLDQDCSGADGIDLDGDGFAASSVGGPDCDDTNPLFNPGALDEVGDDIDQNCDGLDGVDADQDGYASIESLGSDCNDLEAMTHIGSADNVGDLVDNNCDGVDGVDADQDGQASTQSGGTDCDDSVATTYVGAADSVGDAVDNNCDGIDGVDADQDGQASTQSGGTDCDDSVATTYVGAADSVGDAVDNNCDGIDGVDADRDGHASTQSGGSDCDDSRELIKPGAVDNVGDSVDNNCDGIDGVDSDADGHASLSSGGDDCDDADASTHPGAEDLDFNGVDHDCDGFDGNGDMDRDGHIATIFGGDDCNDNDPTVYLGAQEVFSDGKDQDCDGVDDLRVTRVRKLGKKFCTMNGAKLNGCWELVDNEARPILLSDAFLANHWRSVFIFSDTICGQTNSREVICGDRSYGIAPSFGTITFRGADGASSWFSQSVCVDSSAGQGYCREKNWEQNVAWTYSRRDDCGLLGCNFSATRNLEWKNDYAYSLRASYLSNVPENHRVEDQYLNRTENCMVPFEVTLASGEVVTEEFESAMCIEQGLELAKKVTLSYYDTLCARTADGGLFCRVSDIPAEWFSTERASFDEPYQPELGYVTDIGVVGDYFMALDDDGRLRIWKPNGLDVSLPQFH